jgi:hypothetical protein
MHTPGPGRAAQSESAAHRPHVFAAAHTGAVLAQSLLDTHCTQAPLVAQTGCAGARIRHAFIPAGAIMHGTHAPAAEQKGLVGCLLQSASRAHSTQAPVAPHTGLVASRLAQFAAAAAAPAAAHDMHTLDEAEQKDLVAIGQSLSATHSTQGPALHVGVIG